MYTYLKYNNHFSTFNTVRDPKQPNQMPSALPTHDVTLYLKISLDLLL